MTAQWSQMTPDKFDRKPRSTQQAMPLFTPSGLAVSKSADPMGTLDMLALLDDTVDQDAP